MKKISMFNGVVVLLFLIFSMLSSNTFASLKNVFAYVNLGNSDIGFINTKSNKHIITSLASLEGWPNSKPWHVWVSPNARKVIVSTESTDNSPSTLVFLNVSKLNWGENTVDLDIFSVLELEAPGTISVFPEVHQTDPTQPIADWILPSNSQPHGPTSLPYTNYVYFTQWTGNKIRVVDYRKGVFAAADPISFADVSQNHHGVNFNSSGTRGLGTGYTYDNNEIDVYRTKPVSGDLKHVGSIVLRDGHGYAALTHYTVWLNNRFALTATMQFGNTSLTPAHEHVTGPSVWLLDVFNMSAKKIIHPTNRVNGSGIYRSASDLAISGNKLFIAEEDSLDGSFGDDGYISIFDISNINKPKFIKRLKPGHELPDDFSVAHGISATPDERSIYVASYASDYIVKINARNNLVKKIYSKLDGLNVAHGGYIAGNSR